MLSITVNAETNSDGSGVALLVDTFVDCGIVIEDAIVEPGIVEDGILEGAIISIPDDCALVNIDTSLSFVELDQLMPGSASGLSQLQRVGWRVRVGGVQVPSSELLNQSVTVSRSLDRPVQVGQFSTIALDGRSPLGDPAALGAPITGLATIDMSLVYHGTGIVFEEPLITNGVAQSSSRSVGAAIIDQVDVADRGWRFVNQSADLNLRPGSRVKRGELIRKMAAAAGVPSILMAGFRGQVSKAVQLVKSDWLAAAQGQAEIEGGHLGWNRRGEFVARFDAPERPLGPVRWSFRPKDIISAINGSPTPMTIDPAPDAWTGVKLRGTKQVEADQATCGKTTIKLTSRNTSRGAQRFHAFQQIAGGSLNVVASNVPEPFIGRQLKQRTTSFITRECEEIVATRTVIERSYNIKTARFRLDGTSPSGITAFFLDAFVDGEDVGNIGYYSSVWRLMETDRINESREFDSDGFLVREVRETFAWYLPRLHQKARADASVSWDTSTNENDFFLDLGNQQMVTQQRETFVRISRQEILYTNDNGYMLSREQITEGFGRIIGVTYLYHDGEFGQDRETFQVTEQVFETWEAVGEGSVRYTRRSEGLDGTLIQEPVFGSITLGQPPAAIKRSDATPDPEDFDTEEEAEAAVAASRFEQQTIRAECSASALETVRPVKVLENAFWEHAETEQELSDVCTRVMLFGMAFGLTWTVPVNGRIEEGDIAYVQGVPGSGIDHRVLIVEVTHDGAPLGPITTVLRGIVYPDQSFLSYSSNPEGA